MFWKVPLFKIAWNEDDVDSVSKVIRTGMNWAEGDSIEIFERRLAKYVGTKFCVLFNSGTSALHASLLSIGIGKGDEVIVPSFTFVATPNAALFVGAKPIFADVDEETLGLDPRDVQEKITRKTRAVLPIHYGGSPCRIRELQRLCKDYKLSLIEDAAESLGATVESQMTGSFGVCSVLSFCQNKIITTGEGGAVVTDSKKIFERLKLIVSHGRPNSSNYFSSSMDADYVTLGYNFRMPTALAALGVSQIARIRSIIRERVKRANYYDMKLADLDKKHLKLLSSPNGYSSVHQLYTVRAARRDGLMRWLANQGVMTRVYFPPVHQTHFYRNVLGYRCALPVTSRLSKEVITLPLYPTLSHEEIDYIAEKIGSFYNT